MKYFPILLAAGLIALAACKSPSSKPTAPADLLAQAGKSPNVNAGSGKFTIQAPEGWQKWDTSLSGVRATVVIAPGNGPGFRPNINVVSESMNNHSLDDYFDQNVVNMGKYLPAFTAGEQGKKEINGMPARWLRYRQSQNGTDLEDLMYVIPKNGIAYIITGTALKGQMQEYQPQFEAIIGTFQAN